jgi:N-acetyltransferase
MQYPDQEVTLEGDQVILKPIAVIYQAQIIEAIKDGNLDKLWYTAVPSPDKVEAYIKNAIKQQQAKQEIAFVVFSKALKRIIGSSRFCNIDLQNNRLEIGYTWYSKSCQRTAINTEAKSLMLNYAFETLHVNAVEFRTHWINQQSRNAILRLGAKKDGVLRNHKIMADGSIRDTVVYSIIQSEWPMIKQHLAFKLSENR